MHETNGRRQLILLAGLALVVTLTYWWQGSATAQTPEPKNVLPNPRLLSESITAGQITLVPNQATAGELGTWKVHYQVGERPIKTGGGIRIQLPEAFHAGIRNSAFPLQATRPDFPNYVKAYTLANADLQTTVEFETDATLVKAVKPSNLSNRMGYYVYVTRIVVLKGEIKQGETLSVVYGDRTQGSTGMRAGILKCDSEPLLVAIDTEGTNEFRLHENPPRCSIAPGMATEMLLTAPSEVSVGERARLRISLLDSHGNAASGFQGEVGIRVRGGQVELSSSARVGAGKGWTEVEFLATKSGVLRFEATEHARNLQARSNPVEVLKQKPQESLFWGDLHSHTRYSVADGVGRGEDAFDYARYVTGLDFYAMTDHSESRPSSEIASALSEREWKEYTRLTDRHYDPGKFATLHAYEASFDSPYGHHNVYFRGVPGPLLGTRDFTLREMWNRLKPGEALTIPHHTLKMPARIDWSATDDGELRRNFEIYSGHGLSEEYDPFHPLAFEQSLFTNPSVTTLNGMGAQRAWQEGFKLSTIASSDNHRAQPGQPHHGLAAVRAGSLTREGVFDALYQRRTYGTTGARIILDFDVNDVPMGGIARSRGTARIRLRAIGTDVIERIEILRHTKGQRGFDVILKEFPAQEEVTLNFDDPKVVNDTIYYARLQQRHLVRERVAMAWSSPVWVTVD